MRRIRRQKHQISVLLRKSGHNKGKIIRYRLQLSSLWKISVSWMNQTGEMLVLGSKRNHTFLLVKLTGSTKSNCYGNQWFLSSPPSSNSPSPLSPFTLDLVIAVTSTGFSNNANKTCQLFNLQFLPCSANILNFQNNFYIQIFLSSSEIKDRKSCVFV